FRLYLTIDCFSGRFSLCNNSTSYADFRAGAFGWQPAWHCCQLAQAYGAALLAYFQASFSRGFLVSIPSPTLCKMRLCFASNNAHKLDEIRPLLPATVQLLSLADIGCHEELPETQPTLEGNARQKAQYVFDHYGVSCFADDTGLEVAALGGAPGVYSARYAGPQREAADNVAKLLHELAT
nr:hypothetical protein [Tanacetum cinerariifolium]